MEERPPTWRAEQRNNQSRTTDKGWSSSLGVWRRANYSSPYKATTLEITSGSLELGLILWYEAINRQGKRDSARGKWIFKKWEEGYVLD